MDTGELCIYDYKDIDKMTQITADDILKHSKSSARHSKSSAKHSKSSVKHSKSSVSNARHCSICGSASHIKSNRKYHPV